MYLEQFLKSRRWERNCNGIDKERRKEEKPKLCLSRTPGLTDSDAYWKVPWR